MKPLYKGKPKAGKSTLKTFKSKLKYQIANKKEKLYYNFCY